MRNMEIYDYQLDLAAPSIIYIFVLRSVAAKAGTSATFSYIKTRIRSEAILVMIFNWTKTDHICTYIEKMSACTFKNRQFIKYNNFF